MTTNTQIIENTIVKQDILSGTSLIKELEIFSGFPECQEIMLTENDDISFMTKTGEIA